MAVRTEEALRAAARAGRPEMRAEAMLLIALILQHSGELAESKPLLEEVLEMARPLGRSRPLLGALVFRGCVHYWQSEYARAEECLSEALALASELRDAWLVLVSRMFLGLAQGNLARMSEALATLEEAMAMARRNGDRIWLPRLANHVGWIHRELQDFEGAVARDEEGLRIAQQSGVPEAEASALLNLAFDHTQAGRLDEAAAIFERVPGERETWFGWLHAMRLHAALGEYGLKRGDLDKAAEHGRRLLETATRHEARTYTVAAHRLLAELALARGELSVAVAHLAGARQQLRAQPAPLAAWKTYATLGRLRAALGDRERASQAWGEAAAVVRAIAGSVADPALRATFLGSPAAREILDASESH
jgi:tetratricopeptide (TPR) repeat protein